MENRLKSYLPQNNNNVDGPEQFILGNLPLSQSIAVGAKYLSEDIYNKKNVSIDPALLFNVMLTAVYVLDKEGHITINKGAKNE